MSFNEKEEIGYILNAIRRVYINRFNYFAELREKNLKAKINDNALYDLGEMDCANSILDMVNELSITYDVELK